MSTKWIAGSDHAGLELKNRLIAALKGWGDEVVDLGTFAADPVDYPDFAEPVARRVAAGEGLGLLVCGTGVGMAMAANKVPGVRAAVVTDVFTAQATRAHNDANLIALGSRVTRPEVAEVALRTFRDTEFEGGRHSRRVAKLAELDARRAGEPGDAEE